MTKGCLWITWGNKQPPLLERSVLSAKKFGYQTCLVTNAPWPDYVDEIMPFKPAYYDCRCRAVQLLEYMPFDVTLMLDTDTVLLDHVEYGFEQAKRHDLACCIAPASDAVHWHRMRGYPEGMPQYNGGVLFMSRACLPMIRQWRDNNDPEMSTRFTGQDQPGLAAAVYDMRMSPYVLPKEWNFRFGMQTEGFGPIRIWHANADPPKGELHGFWRAG